MASQNPQLQPEKISPEAIAAERARRGIADSAPGAGSEMELAGQELMAFYMDPGFKTYVQGKFAVRD